MVKIFATGTTGYIGGDALYAIAHAHPEYEITCAARDSSRGALIAAQYPNFKLAYGDLDSHDMLAEEASKADIVVHTADCDHEASARSLIEGLARRGADRGVGFLVHTSGTGILTFEDLKRGAAGLPSDKVFDDWDGVGEITSLPDEAWHRPVDKVVLGAGQATGGRVKTAIVCPPTINGPGRGPGNRRSDQVPKMAAAAMRRGKAFVVGEGKNKWNSVHVHDLSDVFLKLVEAAAAGGAQATWGSEGYYFTEAGDFFWGDISKLVAQEGHKQGYLTTAELNVFSLEDADKAEGHGGGKWGCNSRGRAIRAKKVLGWDPKGESIQELVPWIVEQEALTLGLKKSHAEKAAGDA